jgi:hypothetical protein
LVKTIYFDTIEMNVENDNHQGRGFTSSGITFSSRVLKEDTTMIDGIERTAFHHHKTLNGIIITFEKDRLGELVRITFCYGIDIYEDAYNEIMIVVPFDKLKINQNIWTIYLMSKLMTEDCKKLYWCNSTFAWYIKGFKLLHEERFSNKNKKIAYIHDHGDVWSDEWIIDEVIQEIFKNILEKINECSVFVDKKPDSFNALMTWIGIRRIYKLRKQIDNVDKYFNMLVSFLIDEMEQDLIEIEEKVKREYLYHLGVDEVMGGGLNDRKEGLRNIEDIRAILTNLY